MRARARMTPEAWLLWLLAAALAAGLAFWDFSTSDQRSAPAAGAEADEITIDIVSE